MILIIKKLSDFEEILFKPIFPALALETNYPNPDLIGFSHFRTFLLSGESGLKFCEARSVFVVCAYQFLTAGYQVLKFWHLCQNQCSHRWYRFRHAQRHENNDRVYDVQDYQVLNLTAGNTSGSHFHTRAELNLTKQMPI
jgi:hypothetical protein